VALVEQANRERVVTNLHVAFVERGWPPDAPEDLREYLALVYESNATKNLAIRQMALDVAAILVGAGAAFAFLKGANWLLEVADERIGEHRCRSWAKRMKTARRGSMVATALLICPRQPSGAEKP
jgi:hypothetical protein